MKINHLQRLALVGIIGLSFLCFIAYNLELNNAQGTQESQVKPKPQATELLYPGEYVFLHGVSNDYIEWYYTSPNSKARMAVLLMKEEEFERFENDDDYDATVLSGRDENVQQGRINVLTEEEWYVVFLNDESDSELTNIQYEAEFHYSDLKFKELDPIILGIVIGFPIATLVVMGGLAYRIPANTEIDKKLSEEIDSLSASPSRPQIRYCIHCGSHLGADQSHCDACGADL